MRLRISARKSDLARLQAYQVGKALTEKNPSLEISYNFRESLGDKNLTDPLWKMPEKGVFTEDFVQDLLNQKTDLVVHSWKDLPTQLRSGTKIIATLPRADQRDLLLFKKSSEARVLSSKTLQVYSSSPRRAYNLENFLKAYLPAQPSTVQFKNVRGNIQTRVRKLLEDSSVDALIVAKAALDRLLTAEEAEFAETRNFLRSALNDLKWMVLPLSMNPNAAAQGALAIEIKEDRPELEELLRTIQCQKTFDCVQQERQVLSSYGGGCHQKIGVAVLPREYGSVFFLRGLTDAGQVLAEQKVVKSSARDVANARHLQSRKYSTEQLGTSRELTVNRLQIPAYVIPSDAKALWIAKAEAMPSDLRFTRLLWAAGLTTWRKLAERGYWVHGSAEGLGESEDPRLQALAPDESKSWIKLTHSQSESVTAPNFKTIATYDIKVVADGWSVGTREFFFWHSGSQFLAALKADPQVKAKKHACGPGSTFAVLREHLGADADIEIYLNEEEWRSSCNP